MIDSSRRFVAAAAFTLAMLFTTVASAQQAGTTIPRLAIAANSGGPYAGLFDELIQALASDAAYIRNNSILNELGKKGPFTVFAPTDGAFMALKQTLACNGLALSDVPDTVRTVLASHAAAGELFAADVLASPTITTLSGATFAQSGGVITDAAGQEINILVTDLVADNGVVHVIDGVLLPVDLGLMPCP